MIFWFPYCWICICFTQMLLYGIWCNHVAESCKILECLILNCYSHPWNELHKPDRTNFLRKRADEGEMEKTSYFSGFWWTGDTTGKIRGTQRIQIFLHNLRYWYCIQGNIWSCLIFLSFTKWLCLGNCQTWCNSLHVQKGDRYTGQK